MERFVARWLIERIFGLAELIMPDERKQWARAMKAEASHVGSDAAAVSFAGGCLWAAFLEYVAAETSKSAAVLCAGVTAGFVFFAHSAVEGSGAWPLLWPLLGGAMTVLLFGQRHGRPALRRGAWLGLRAGLVAALLFTTAGAILIGESASVTLDSRLHTLVAGALLGTLFSVIGAGAATLIPRLP